MQINYQSCDNSCRKCSILTIDQTLPTQIHGETSFKHFLCDSPNTSEEGQKCLSAQCFLNLLVSDCKASPPLWAICLSGVLKFRFPVHTWSQPPAYSALRPEERLNEPQSLTSWQFKQTFPNFPKELLSCFSCQKGEQKWRM